MRQLLETEGGGKATEEPSGSVARAGLSKSSLEREEGNRGRGAEPETGMRGQAEIARTESPLPFQVRLHFLGA